jgi:hypothetical protein
VAGATWWTVMRIVAVGDLMQRTGDDCTAQIPSVVCTMHVETRSVIFLVEPQNQGQEFVSGLASKPL